MEGQKKVESDFLLRAVRIRNTTSKSVHIIKCCFDIRSKGKSRKKICYSEEVVKERSLALLKLKERLMAKRSGIPEHAQEILRKGNILLLMGTEKFWNKNQIFTNTLEPNQETGFIQEHFRIATTEPIDELVFTVVYIQENERMSTSTSIPVIQYKNKNRYMFPLKGAWMILGNWDDPYNHRTHHSQEFAFDLVQLDKHLRFVQNQEKPNEEYPCYGQDIFAIANGEVVDCLDNVPEIPSATTHLTREQSIQLIQEKGFLSLVSGNFVVLKHLGDEHSFYGHMSPGTLKVKKGDTVKQRQILGKVDLGFRLGHTYTFSL